MSLIMSNSITKASLLVTGLFGMPESLVKNINSGINYSYRVFVLNEAVTDE